MPEGATVAGKAPWPGLAGSAAVGGGGGVGGRRRAAGWLSVWGWRVGGGAAVSPPMISAAMAARAETVAAPGLRETREPVVRPEAQAAMRAPQPVTAPAAPAGRAAT